MKEIRFEVWLFFIGLILGFFSLVILAVIKKCICSNSKRRKKEQFRRMIEELQTDDKVKGKSE